MFMRGALCSLLFLGLLLGAASAADKTKPSPIGEKAPGGALRDVRGNRRALHDFKGNKALVVAFVGTDCPVSNLYLPELIELEKKSRKKGVQFLAVYPNESEDLEQ